MVVGHHLLPGLHRDCHHLRLSAGKKKIIPAAEVREIDEAWRRAARESRGVTRDDECNEANQGLARPDIITNP